MNYEPDLRAKLQIAKNNYQMFGLTHTLREGLRYLLAVAVEDDFDRRYGVATSGSVEVSKGGIADDFALSNALGYSPIREPVMRHILASVTHDMDLRASSFVDLGCGKGRALIMAAALPFKSVIGVEISPLHAAVAERNVARYLSYDAPRQPVQCRDMRVLCASATEFAYPDADLLIYLFRPFVGPVFRAVLDNLAQFRARTQRTVRLVLTYPREEFILDAHPSFTKQREFQVIDDTYSWSLWTCDAVMPRAAGRAANVNGAVPE